jgi:hypothetical protein
MGGVPGEYRLVTSNYVKQSDRPAGQFMNGHTRAKGETALFRQLVEGMSIRALLLRSE